MGSRRQWFFEFEIIMNNYQTDEIDDLIDLLNSGAPSQSQQSPVEQIMQQYSVAKNKQNELQKINDDLKL